MERQYTLHELVPFLLAIQDAIAHVFTAWQSLPPSLRSLIILPVPPSMPVDIESDGEPHEGAAPSPSYEEPANHVFEADDEEEHAAEVPGETPSDHIPHSPEFPPSPTLDPPSEPGEPSPEPNPSSSAHPETPMEEEEEVLNRGLRRLWLN